MGVAMLLTAMVLAICALFMYLTGNVKSGTVCFYIAATVLVAYLYDVAR